MIFSLLLSTVHSGIAHPMTPALGISLLSVAWKDLGWLQGINKW